MEKQYEGEEMILTKIEVIDPQIPEKPLGKIVVPGTLVPEQIRKELRIGLTLKIDLGEKTKKKTFTIKVYDEELKKAILKYIENITLKLIEIENEERVLGELKVADIPSA